MLHRQRIFLFWRILCSVCSLVHRRIIFWRIVQVRLQTEVDAYKYASMHTSTHSAKTQVDAYEYASEVDAYEYASMRTSTHSAKTQVDAYEYASMHANTHFARNQKLAKKENPKSQ